MIWKLILPAMAKIFGVIMDAISPHLRELIETTVIDLHKKALETENPWDDHLTELLAEILKIELPES